MWNLEDVYRIAKSHGQTWTLDETGSKIHSIQESISFLNSEQVYSLIVKGVSDMILMCKDVPVYNIKSQSTIDDKLIPGAIKHGALTFKEWMKTRYSVGSNVSARRLMLRAFGTDNHNQILKQTRALSLSDCYWLKEQGEDVKFHDVSPYFNREWDGTGKFSGGSISTLFVNGAADKVWLDASTLLKKGSQKEYSAYRLCDLMGLAEFASQAKLDEQGLLVTNFTSEYVFLESLEQSGLVGEFDAPIEKAIKLFKEQAVALVTVDYLVEHDDRHWGNIGLLRDTDTGDLKGMSPYYDFDWLWCGYSVELPGIAFIEYGDYIRYLATLAKSVSHMFKEKKIIEFRADELIKLCK